MNQRATETAPLSAASLSEVARRLFADESMKQRFRPFICPFEELLPLVPSGARMLDAGCGAGLFLGLLAMEGRIRAGVGFDSAAAAISSAQRMARRAAGLGSPATLEFIRLDATAAWPEGHYDVVSLIDVLHHVPKAAQRRVFELAVRRLDSAGRLIYKDMARAPAWRAWANRLHDLALAGEWIHYVPIEEVERWAADMGLRVLEQGSFNRYCYAHELRVFGRA